MKGNVLQCDEPQTFHNKCLVGEEVSCIHAVLCRAQNKCDCAKGVAPVHYTNAELIVFLTAYTGVVRLNANEYCIFFKCIHTLYIHYKFDFDRFESHLMI